MKNIVYLLFSFFFISCGTQNKIVTYKKQNLEFIPHVEEKSIANKLKIKIEPIDAQTINREAFESLGADGGYNTNLINSNGKEKNDQKAINLFKGIDMLLDDNKLPNHIGVMFKQMIYSLYAENSRNWYDGSEVDIINQNEIFSKYNPYKINNKYLSLYKISISNDTEEIKLFNINDIQLSNQNQQLKPFKINYFENLYSDYIGKMIYIHKMNLPDEIRVLPGEKVNKIFSTPTIQNFDELKFSIVQNNIITDYNFKGKWQIEESIHKFEKYSILKIDKNDLYIVELPNGIFFPITKNQFYLNTDFKTKNITVYGINIINSRNSATMKLGKVDIVPNTLNGKIIRLNFKDRVKFNL